MSPKEKIAKLEGILARVKERAEAPRPNGATYAAAAAPMHGSGAEAHQTPTAPPPSSIGAPATIASIPPDGAGWSEPPPTNLEEVSMDAEVTVGEEVDLDGDVEVSSEVVEVDIDIDEPGMMPAESGAQPVADHLEASPELEEIPQVDVAPPANEVVEPAPSSSPRPIISEVPSYEEESAPRHTPPPESGKQVAAPSVKPEPVRKSAAPPPSDGHTLMGGWREPGMPLPRDPGAEPRIPAVRVPPPPPPPPDPIVHAAPPPPPPARLSPEVTRVELPGDARVAAIAGAVPSFAPSTFGELLDASIGL